MKPPDFDPTKKYPMVLEIHGGPHTAYGTGFFHEFQCSPPRATSCSTRTRAAARRYGQEFGNVIQYRFPGDDAKDLLAGVDAVIARGYVDASRIGVTGGSGGGLLTNWLIMQIEPFRGRDHAALRRGVGVVVLASTSRCSQPFWFRKPPFEDPAGVARALAGHATSTKIETPLMVLHSEEDWRTPIAQGEAMFRALKRSEKPAVMVRFPGESHELSRSGTPSRRVQNQQHIRAGSTTG